MKNIFHLLMACLFPVMSFAANPQNASLSKAENVVDELFKNLRSISNTHASTSVVSKIRYEFENYFESPDQPCPNEFKNIWKQNIGAISYTTDIRPARYFDLFFQIFRDTDYSNCSFSFERLNSCLVKEPEFKKDEEPAKLAQVVIRKVYSRNNKPFGAFNDTLVVGLEELKIRAWANNSSRHSIGYFGGEVLDVEQLKISAALAYNSGQYVKAYQIYQSIIAKYPEEGDPYYRMAVMIYDKDYGVKKKKALSTNLLSNTSKKSRENLILEYLNKAKKYGGSSTRKCADNMKYWITC